MPLSESPACKEMLPAVPLRVLPVDTSTEPEVPEPLGPLLSWSEPDAAEEDAPDPINTAPESLTDAPD